MADVESVLRILETEGIEREALQLAIQRAQQIVGLNGQPILSDWSPSSPQSVLLQAAAALSGMAVYYAHNIPLLIENYLVRELMAASELPAQPATLNVSVELYNPAPSGGFAVAAGTVFQTGPLNYALLSPLLIPEGKTGTEQSNGQYLYFAPARCQTAGKVGNIAADTPLQPATPLVGVKRAWAASDGQGGTDAETYKQMLDRIFRRQLDDNQAKLVTIADFVAYTQRRLGVGARVHILTPPPTPGKISISILHPNGAALDNNDPILAELNERSPLAPVEYVAPLIVPVTVAANLLYSPRLVAADALMQAANDALNRLLSPATWERWGSSNNILPVSRILATLQNLTGVSSVTVSAPSSDINLGQPHASPLLAGTNLTLIPEA